MPLPGNRSWITFCVLAYALSYGAAIAIHATGGKESSLVGLLLLCMFVPAIAAVIIRLVFREGFGDIDWKAFSLRWLIPGMLLFPILAWIVAPAYLCITGQDITWAAWLTPAADGMITPLADTGLGEPFPAEELNGKLLKKLLLNLPILCILTFGEEFGWRSFLQTRLMSRYGARTAIVWTAFIWGYWHLGFHTLDMGDTNGFLDILGALVIAPLSLAAVGIVFGWLYYRTGSLWVVVVAHAAVNKWTAVPLRYLEHPGGNEGATLAYLIAAIVVGALWLWKMPIDD
jgi:membrane protease YdiL (CAAX protease family)